MWFKVCNSLAQHRKALEAGAEAIGLWTLAGAWSCGQLTNGFVPDSVVARLVANAEALASRLVQVGLWERVENGYQFHEWTDYQPDAEQERHRQEQRREAGRKGGLRSGKSRRERTSSEQDEASASASASADASASASAGAQAEGQAKPNPDTDTEVSPYGDTRNVADEPRRADVDQLCERLLGRLQARGVRATITKRWRTDARLLLDRDGRDLNQALWLIDWATDHEFWSANIHSIPKFRKQYDRLRMQAEQRPLRAVAGNEDWRRYCEQ